MSTSSTSGSVDDGRNIIALELTWRRDKSATARALREARAEAGFAPDIIVLSDGSLAYPPAIAEVIHGARQVVAQFKGAPVSHR